MAKYCPSLAASTLSIVLGIARDRSRGYGVRDECCSRATNARTSWALGILSASRVWREVVRASENLPVFHLMLPGSVMAAPIVRDASTRFRNKWGRDPLFDIGE